jgi:hypothetical protein
MIAAGAGIPLYWMAEADHTARGTAAEQSEPTYRHYRQRQLFFGWAMRRLAVDALQSRGLVDVGVDDIVAEFSELDRSEALFTASAVAQLTDTLATAQEQGWLRPEDAAAVYQHFVGMEMDLPAGEDLGGGKPFPNSNFGSFRRRADLRGRRPRRRAGSGGVNPEPGALGPAAASVADPVQAANAVAPDPTVRI